jgi:hypothetical protein
MSRMKLSLGVWRVLRSLETRVFPAHRPRSAQPSRNLFSFLSSFSLRFRFRN